MYVHHQAGVFGESCYQNCWIFFDFEVSVKRGSLKNVESPSLAFIKEPPGKLLHRLMLSESVPVVATVVDCNDDFSN